MKSIKLFFISLFAAITSIFSQDTSDECRTKLSIFHEHVKVENYNAAYKPWAFVKDSCPKLNIAIYTDGEKILKYKIANTSENEQKEFVEALIELLQMRIDNFPKKAPVGVFSSKKCQLMYDYRNLLQKNNTQLFDCFDATYKTDKATFTHPKSLYTYFSLVIDLYKEDKKSIQDVFDTYDAIIEKIQYEIKNYSENLNTLIQKEENGEVLTKNEKDKVKAYKSYLKNYDLISKNINTKLGILADCENLIPLYTKTFEANKNDSFWLKRAVSRMYHKECTEDPLYEKLVKAYDEVEPSADTKYFVATILVKKGKFKEAETYLKESYDLETDAFKKSRRANSNGALLKKLKRYSEARKYFRKALKLNPSSGSPYLAIAKMYAESAKNCGDTNFNKRAVYWLAAEQAKKALRLDPVLRNKASQLVERYNALAPSREEIFKCACSGKVIAIGCWINDKVVVPKIK
ncbi:tetratricopeptide repeat protein [Hyunsoonleella pacifica]|nr:tetratricopeptide repeat protein [Hyunsoonleella pacifica]GGD17874.1 hypothetical protein GCM10011368_19700 [Hyunsoonleella pacifica]